MHQRTAAAISDFAAKSIPASAARIYHQEERSDIDFSKTKGSMWRTGLVADGGATARTPGTATAGVSVVVVAYSNRIKASGAFESREETRKNLLQRLWRL